MGPLGYRLLVIGSLALGRIGSASTIEGWPIASLDPAAISDHQAAYYQIKLAEVLEVEDDVLPSSVPSSATSAPSLLDLSQLDHIIRIGKEIWRLIVDNKADIAESTGSVSALPEGATSWLQMESWQPPKSKSYRVVYKNLLNMEVVRFQYRVIYTYGGSVKGIGKYLAGVKVEPSGIDVKWGFRVDAEAIYEPPLNVGTSLEPMAGLEVSIKWKVGSLMSVSAQKATFFIQGDGQLQSLNDGSPATH